ncbi:hypothetical protein JCM3775_002242 [Rhodotorula graminis]
MRVQPSVSPSPPSSQYFDLAHESGVTLASSAAASRLPPLVVVLSPSYTLVCRVSSSNSTLIVRPYLSTLLAYLYRRRRPEGFEHEPAREVRIVVFSAMRIYNLATALHAIGLEQAPSVASTAKITSAEGTFATTESADNEPLLDLVLSRESMGLDTVDYERDVVTVKGLAIVWRGLGLEAVDGIRTTVLVDESVQAAFPQPHSRLSIAPFEPDSGSAVRSGRVRELPGSTCNDTALLSTIYYLELLGREANVPAALKGGLVRRSEVDARRVVRAREGLAEGAEVSLYDVQEELARRGRAVCAEYGIEVSREWDE